ncbi:hypothetical protein [uncultured Thiothrix sp.]|uniref:hypothetical protein n=1 Tax=uncultured Thiothrix sp. TaxID=223185 RepID=UPI002629032F|nr:hypothetical protein [uncultured Thiothrix sp.]HMT92648.1 hypothetical protein [Thiolinea sp.]
MTGDSKNRTAKGYDSAKAQLDAEISKLKTDIKSKFSEIRADMQAFLNFNSNTPAGSNWRFYCRFRFFALGFLLTGLIILRR